MAGTTAFLVNPESIKLALLMYIQECDDATIAKLAEQLLHGECYYDGTQCALEINPADHSGNVMGILRPS